MEFVQAEISELPEILNIVSDAQRYLASQNIDQWQNGYPNALVMEKDISNKESFVVKNAAGEIMGIAMFTTHPEPTYSFIEGNWLTSENARYSVIHRMAVSDRFRNQGVAKFIFKTCEQLLKKQNIPSMRIDTHQDNTDMQQLLKKNGYVYCGIIYLENKDKRLAFEKILRK